MALPPCRASHARPASTVEVWTGHRRARCPPRWYTWTGLWVMLNRGAAPRPLSSGGTVRHKLVLLAAATLLSGVLTGCGGGDSEATDSYCDSLKDAKADIETLDAG